MASEVNAELKAELIKARAAIIPELSGQRLLTTAPISKELRDVIQNQISVRERRILLIEALMSALDEASTKFGTLQADGYPHMDAVQLPENLYVELQKALADIAGGSGVFQPPPAPAPKSSAASKKE